MSYGNFVPAWRCLDPANVTLDPYAATFDPGNASSSAAYAKTCSIVDGHNATVECVGRAFLTQPRTIVNEV